MWTLSFSLLPLISLGGLISVISSHQSTQVSFLPHLKVLQKPMSTPCPSDCIWSWRLPVLPCWNKACPLYSLSPQPGPEHLHYLLFYAYLYNQIFSISPISSVIWCIASVLDMLHINIHYAIWVTTWTRSGIMILQFGLDNPIM